MSNGERRAFFVVRIWLPDRPGALGQAASRIGAVGGDVLGIDVVDRGAGRAIDELTVDLDSSRVDLLIREVNAVDGVDIEEVREVARPAGDARLVALEAAGMVVGAATRDDLHAVLCDVVTGMLHGDWAAVARDDDGMTFACTGAAPASVWLEAFAQGAGMSIGHGGGNTDGEELAWAPLRGLDRLLVVGRDTSAFTTGEIAVVSSLAELAATRLHELDHLPEIA